MLQVDQMCSKHVGSPRPQGWHCHALLVQEALQPGLLELRRLPCSQALGRENELFPFEQQDILIPPPISLPPPPQFILADSWDALGDRHSLTWTSSPPEAAENGSSRCPLRGFEPSFNISF